MLDTTLCTGHKKRLSKIVPGFKELADSLAEKRIFQGAVNK